MNTIITLITLLMIFEIIKDAFKYNALKQERDHYKNTLLMHQREKKKDDFI